MWEVWQLPGNLGAQIHHPFAQVQNREDKDCAEKGLRGK